MSIVNEEIVSSFKSSGLTQAAFCNQFNISIERLRYYLYKKNKKQSSLSPKKTNQPAFLSITPPVSLRTYTIIHGQFTAVSLAALVKELK